MKFFHIYLFILIFIIFLFPYKNLSNYKKYDFIKDKNYIFIGNSILQNNKYVPFGTSIELFFPHNNYECFTNNNYIFIGDSILQNNKYVPFGTSVEQRIVNKNNKNVYFIAEDDSKIVNVYKQLDKLSYELNNDNTFVFLSVGGNDILSYYIQQSKLNKNTHNNIDDNKVLQNIFASYQELIKSIQTKLPNTKIFLLDIYYPTTIKYKKYKNIIEKWNNKIYKFANNYNNNIYGLIKISKHLTNDEDFTYDIEPSSIGSKKIVDLILSNI